jgi:hypothetical protein
LGPTQQVIEVIFHLFSGEGEKQQRNGFTK